MTLIHCAPNRRTAQPGFSLVELMVVVAIILVLLALIIPTGKAARDRAETIDCASKVRSIGLAASLYVSDHNGYMLGSWEWSVGPGENMSWNNGKGTKVLHTGPLWPYLGDESLYLCDTFKRLYGINPAATRYTPIRSYSMNEYFNKRRGWQYGLTMSRTMIEKPQALALFSEESTWLTPYSRWIINNSALGVGGYLNNNHHVDAIASYHNPVNKDIKLGSGNVSFADGHVKLIENSRSKDVFTPERIKEKK